MNIDRIIPNEVKRLIFYGQKSSIKCTCSRKGSPKMKAKWPEYARNRKKFNKKSEIKIKMETKMKNRV